MAINPLAQGPGAISSVDRPDNFDRAVRDIGIQPGGSSERSQDLGALAPKPPLTLAQIIQEAARRSGIVNTGNGFTKADVLTINNEIRKDPVLYEALVRVRTDHKRGQGKLDDSEVGLDAGQGKRMRERQARVSYADDDGGMAGAQAADGRGLHVGQAGATESRTGAVSALSGFDIAAEMLVMFDYDGDGIINARQVLEFLIVHESNNIRFNEIEFANIIKILTDGVNEAGLDAQLGRRAPAHDGSRQEDRATLDRSLAA